MLGETDWYLREVKLSTFFGCFIFLTCPKEGHAYAMAGGLGGATDFKINCKYVWQFIYAIADAELLVVSCVMLIANGIVFWNSHFSFI
jgi:hypothetical protein